MISPYPWYDTVEGDDLEQGDILESCPVFIPPSGLTSGALLDATFEWEERNVIVLSQTCDMVKGREKLTEVLLCPVWGRSELTRGYLSTARGMEDARRGNLPAFHVIAACSNPGIEREVRVVEFSRVFSLPIDFVRAHARRMGDRARLLPPYREHLAQGFARFFMRIGLPVDIPAFK